MLYVHLFFVLFCLNLEVLPHSFTVSVCINGLSTLFFLSFLQNVPPVFFTLFHSGSFSHIATGLHLFPVCFFDPLLTVF